MTKCNPLIICTETNKPYCYGEFDDNNVTCVEDCIYNQDCHDEFLVETENRNVNVRRPDGKPICFSDYYSPFGPSCLNKCFYKDRCEEETERNINRPLTPDSAIRSEKLNVIGNPWSPPGSSSNPFNLKTTQYTPQISSGTRRTINNEQALKYYNQPLHENPLVVNQFANESWISRLIKEFIIHTGDAAIKIMAELGSQTIRNVIWPSKGENK